MSIATETKIMAIEAKVAALEARIESLERLLHQGSDNLAMASRPTLKLNKKQQN